MTTPAPSFGRRAVAAGSTAPSKPTDSSERDRLLYRSIASDAARRSGEADPVFRVPNSVGAGILTGAVIGVAALATHLHDDVSSGFHAGPLVLDLGTSTIPLVLGSTLWAGGQAGFMSAFVVHGILRRLSRTTFTDYAAAGALIALVTSLLCHTLGLPADSWITEAALGAAAGVLYRLFAGLAPAT